MRCPCRHHVCVPLWIILLIATPGTYPPPALAAAPGAADTLLARCLAPGNSADGARLDAMQAVIPFGRDETPEQAAARVQGLARRVGPLEPVLFPELMALGLAREQHGDYAAAATAFRRALYIIRANDGLNSIDQVPVIDSMIRAYTAAADWKRASDAYDLMEWVYHRNFSDDDPRLLPVLTRLRRWHIEAYNKEDGRELDAHYDAAERSYREALAILDHCTGDHRLSLCHFHPGCCTGATASGDACPELDAENFAPGSLSK